MNPLLFQIFKNAIANVALSYKGIAKLLVAAIIDHSLPNGACLPVPKQLAQHLRVPTKSILNAYRYLQNHHKMISKIARGKYVVIAAEDLEVDSSILSYKPHIFFDVVSIYSASEPSRRIESSNYGYASTYQCLPQSKRRQNVTGLLITWFRRKLNKSLCSNYTQKDLVYTTDVTQLFYTIFDTEVTTQQVLVLPDYTPDRIAKIAESVVTKIRTVSTDRPGQWLEELQAICEKETVGLLYLSSRSSYPSSPQISHAEINRLLMLQQEHKFRILEHDQFAGYLEHQTNQFMSAIYKLRRSVIYIRPLTPFDGTIGEVWIAAAPNYLMNRIREKLFKVGKAPSDLLNYCLYHLMEDGVLHASELKALAEMRSAALTVENMLTEAGLWQSNDGASASTGLYYLTPADGYFPADVYEKLLYRGIQVMEPARFGSKGTKMNGVVIALAGLHQNPQKIQNELKALITALNQITKY